MGLRYPSLAIATLLAGGFLVVVTYGFSQSTAVTLGFAVSIGVLAFGLGMVHAGLPHRGHGFTRIGAAIAVLAGWMIVATNVFAESTALWLAFAGALGYVGLALIALALHEVHTERVVHHLEVKSHEPAPA